MINVQNLVKHFNKTIAVDDISFQVREGENLVLLGTSGCGKTTTLKMINRLIEPTSGLIEVNGTNVLQQDPDQLRRKIGYVIQSTGLFPHYTIEGNIAVLPKLLGWKKEKTRSRTKDIIEKLHLPEEYLNKYPHQLSGGQQQRVGLARALVADPPVILMDEPLGALDPITRNSIRKEFKTLEAIKQKTILMVTHDVNEAIDLGDRICLMDKGKIQQIGKPGELLFSPENKFVQHFFDEQRFQLQLKVVTLKEISKYVKVKENGSQGKVFKAGASVFEAMEWLSGDAEDKQSIGIATDDNIIFLERKELMDAFYKAIEQL